MALTDGQSNVIHKLNEKVKLYGETGINKQDIDFLEQNRALVKEKEDQEHFDEINAHIKELFLVDETSAQSLKEAFPEASFMAEEEMKNLEAQANVTGAEKVKSDFFATKKRHARAKLEDIKNKRQILDNHEKERFRNANTPDPRTGLSVVESERQRYLNSKYNQDIKASYEQMFGVSRLSEAQKEELRSKHYDDFPFFLTSLGHADETALLSTNLVEHVERLRGSKQAQGNFTLQMWSFNSVYSRVSSMGAELRQFVGDHPTLFTEKVSAADILDNYGELFRTAKHIQIYADVCDDMYNSLYYRYVYENEEKTNQKIIDEKKQIDETRKLIKSVLSTIQKECEHVEGMNGNDGEEFILPVEKTFPYAMNNYKDKARPEE